MEGKEEGWGGEGGLLSLLLFVENYGWSKGWINPILNHVGET